MHHGAANQGTSAHKIGTRNVDRNGERSQSHMVLHIRVRLDSCVDGTLAKSWFLHPGIWSYARMQINVNKNDIRKAKGKTNVNKETIRSHAHPYAYIHTRARVLYSVVCARSSLQVQRTARLHNKRTTSSTSCNPPTAATGRPPPPQAPAITRQVTDASGPRIQSHPRSPTHPRRLSLTVCLGEWPSISPHASLCVSCNLTRLFLPPPNPCSCCAVAPP